MRVTRNLFRQNLRNDLVHYFVNAIDVRRIIKQCGYEKELSEEMFEDIKQEVKEAEKSYGIAVNELPDNDVVTDNICKQLADKVAKMLYPDTFPLYRKIYDEHPDPYDFKCFLAFSNEQFEEGRQKAKIEEGEKIYRFYGGLYGTKEGIDGFMKAYDNKTERIKEVCDPEDVYRYEYDNHECGYTCDDTEAIELVVSIFGEDLAKQIKRRHGYADIDKLDFK